MMVILLLIMMNDNDADDDADLKKIVFMALHQKVSHSPSTSHMWASDENRIDQLRM
jgi:hypothetical protein